MSEEKLHELKITPKQPLAPELYKVACEGSTEAPFTGKYWNEHAKGMYTCAVCGTELFSSDTKFDSGTGWPSFTNPVNLQHVELREDLTLGMRRTEVVCKTCGALELVTQIYPAAI